MKKLILVALGLIGSIATAFAGDLHGTIKSTEGEVLPFATVYIKELNTGTSSNQDGFYSINLKPGTYHVLFKFLGYESQEHVVKMGSGDVSLAIALKPQMVMLNEVVTTASGADPSAMIMRKAIAKSTYHRKQVDSYQARVYVKGKGKLDEIPFYLRSTLKKQGVDTTILMITESVSEIHFKQPNTFIEKVISVHSQGDDYSSNPSPFIFGSFYQPKIAGAVSPLAPNAFGYYHFKFLGAFEDQGKLIDKIKVTPKAPGTEVFSGTLYIVEDDWAIYSLELTTTIQLGIEFNIKQTYASIEDKAWMPINDEFKVRGKVFGVGFHYHYLASMSDYQIELNKKLPQKLKIIDPKSEKVDRDTLAENLQALKTDTSSNTAITTRQLQKVMKDYQKEELKNHNAITSIYDQSVDSTANQKESEYWQKIRPIPLTSSEKEGYKKMDSLAVIQKKQDKKDSVKEAKRKTFQIQDIALGGDYDLKHGYSLKIHNVLFHTNFNTVEGFNFDYSLSLIKKYKRRPLLKDSIDGYTFSYEDKRFMQTKWDFRPGIRYQFATGEVLPFLKFKLEAGNELIKVEGGTYVKQFNDMPSILPIFNSIATLFFENNFMRIYKQDYVQASWEHKVSDKWSFSASGLWSERYALRNHSDVHIIDYKAKNYESNEPVNYDPANVTFPFHQAAVFDLGLTYEPKLRYRVQNHYKTKIEDISPVFTLQYEAGVPGFLDSDVDFQKLSLEWKQHWRFGVKGKLDLKARVGTFLRNKNTYFMDYYHFKGNETYFQMVDPVGSYRMLPYYYYSTADNFGEAFLYYHFRKLLFTQFTPVRMLGINENVFVNSLFTNQSNAYTEIGYALDGIFKFFRVEWANQFIGGEYKGMTVRFGIATNIGGNISVSAGD